MSVPLVIHSHTDFLDILNIQIYYTRSIKNKILLINESNIDQTFIDSFDQIIFYNNDLPYSSRIGLLKSLSVKSILLMHDNDILIYQNSEIINGLNEYLISNNLDRIDLQYLPNSIGASSINVDNRNYNFNLWSQTPSTYMFNVNPSLWNLTTLIEIVTTFPEKTYRDIELDPVQSFCSKYKIYKLNNHSFINCGYFKCLPFFIFLHITHGGNLLNPNGVTQYGHPPIEPFLQKEYEFILKKFLINTKRNFN